MDHIRLGHQIDKYLKPLFEDYIFDMDKQETFTIQDVSVMDIFKLRIYIMQILEML